jgi:hypothetical protein
VIGGLVAAILMLVSIVALVAWVVFREPWGPLRRVTLSPRAEASERRRTQLMRPPGHADMRVPGVAPPTRETPRARQPQGGM